VRSGECRADKWAGCIAGLAADRKKAAKDKNIAFPGRSHFSQGTTLRLFSSFEYPYGKIWKDGGITINFHVGGNAGFNGAKSTDKEQIQWRYQQAVNGHGVVCIIRSRTSSL